MQKIGVEIKGYFSVIVKEHEIEDEVNFEEAEKVINKFLKDIKFPENSNVVIEEYPVASGNMDEMDWYKKEG
jgi:hypothetical protein